MQQSLRAQSLWCATAVLVLASCAQQHAPEDDVPQAPAAAAPASPARDWQAGRGQASVRDIVRAVATDEVVHVVSFTPPEGVQAPRMAELFLRHSDDLQLVEAQALPVVTASGKDVVGQARPGGMARVLIFSSQNLETLGEGSWVAVWFRKVSSGPAQVELAYDRTAFAPAAVTPRADTIRLVPLEAVP